jgi:hypothetical protein
LSLEDGGVRELVSVGIREDGFTVEDGADDILDVYDVIEVEVHDCGKKQSPTRP